MHIDIYEFYSTLRKNDTMWSEGKWIQLEDIMIMLSEVSQVQTDKCCMFSLICGR
jgi:hypothetical protein